MPHRPENRLYQLAKLPYFKPFEKSIRKAANIYRVERRAAEDPGVTSYYELYDVAKRYEDEGRMAKAVDLLKKDDTASARLTLHNIEYGPTENLTPDQHVDRWVLYFKSTEEAWDTEGYELNLQKFIEQADVEDDIIQRVVARLEEG